MGFIREVATVIIPVAQPLDLDAHVGAVAQRPVSRLVTGWEATFLILCFSAFDLTVAALVHWYAGAGYLKQKTNVEF